MSKGKKDIVASVIIAIIILALLMIAGCSIIRIG